MSTDKDTSELRHFYANQENIGQIKRMYFDEYMKAVIHLIVTYSSRFEEYFPLIARTIKDDIVRCLYKCMANPEFSKKFNDSELVHMMRFLIIRFPVIEQDEPLIYAMCEKNIGPQEGYQKTLLDHMCVINGIPNLLSDTSPDLQEEHNTHQAFGGPSLGIPAIKRLRNFIMEIINVESIIADLFTGNLDALDIILSELLPTPVKVFANDIVDFRKSGKKPITQHIPVEFHLSDTVEFLVLLSNKIKGSECPIVFFITSPPPEENGNIAVLAICLIARLFPIDRTLIFITGMLGYCDGPDGFWNYLSDSPYLQLIGEADVDDSIKFMKKTAYAFQLIASCDSERDRHDGDIFRAIVKAKPSLFPCLAMPKLILVCICGKTSELRACSRCKIQHYCSVECQKKDWTTHKKHCEQPSKK